MKKNKSKNDILDILSTILCYAWIIWFFWSWIEIATHNRTDCQYSAWNMWVLVLDACKRF